MGFIDIISIVVLAILFVTLVLIFIKKPSKVSKSTIWYFIPVLIAGLIIHYVAIRYTKEESLYYNIVYTIILSIKMFGFSFEANLISSVGSISMFFEIVMITTYFFASLSTIIIGVLFFFGNLKSLLVFYLNKKNENMKYYIFSDSDNGINLSLSIKADTYLILSKKNNDERLIKQTSFRNRKSYLIVKDVKSFITKLSSSNNSTLIFYYDNQNKNIELLEYAKENLLNNPKYYAYYNGNIIDGFVDSFSSNQDINLFSTEQLVSKKLFYDCHLFKYLPSEFIDYENSIISNDHSINYYIIGCSDINYSNLENIVKNYRSVGHALNIYVIGENSNEAKEFVNKFYFEHSSLKEYKMLYGNTDYYDLDDLDINIIALDSIVGSFDTLEALNEKKNSFNYIFIDLKDDNRSLNYLSTMNKYLKNKDMENHLFIFKSSTSNLCLKNENKVYEYGINKNVVSKAIILDESVDYLAKLINLYYSKDSIDNIDLLWEKLSSFHKESNRSAAINLIVKLNLLGFDLVQGNLENDITCFEERLHDSKRVCQLTGLSSKLSNIAWQEHLRWNVFELLNGVMPLTIGETLKGKKYNKTNATKTKHANIISFKGIIDLKNDMADENKCIVNSKRDLELVEKDLDIVLNLESIIEKSNFRIVDIKK